MSRRAIIRFLSVLICLLLAGGVGVGYAAWKRAEDIYKNPGEHLTGQKDPEPEITIDPESSEVIAPTPDDTDFVMYKGEKYTYNEAIVTLLLIGIDKDSDRSSARSDVMVLFALDTKTNQPTLIVCPRDTRSEVRHVDKEGKETKVELDKLNHSFPYGNGNNDKNMGAENVMFNIRNFLTCDGKYDEIKITRYGGIDMQGIGPLTNAVGGVTITMPARIPGVGNKGETVKLNSETAELYVRTRYGVEGGSDLSRGRRQMIYMFALLEQIKSIEPGRIPAVYDQIAKNSFTNLTTEDMVAYASLLQDADLAKIYQPEIEGVPQMINKVSYYIPDEEKLEELVISVFYTKLDEVDPTASPSDTVTSLMGEPGESASPSPSASAEDDD